MKTFKEIPTNIGDLTPFIRELSDIERSKLNEISVSLVGKMVTCVVANEAYNLHHNKTYEVEKYYDTCNFKLVGFGTNFTPNVLRFKEVRDALISRLYSDINQNV